MKKNTHLSFLVPEKLPRVFYHLLIRELGVGLLLAEVENFPQSDSKRPHVTRCGEFTLQSNTATITSICQKVRYSLQDSIIIIILTLYMILLLMMIIIEHCILTSKMLSHDIQRIGSTARP